MSEVLGALVLQRRRQQFGVGGGEITYSLAEPRPPPRMRGSARLIRTRTHYAICNKEMGY